jgi:hypothetical protein
MPGLTQHLIKISLFRQIFIYALRITRREARRARAAPVAADGAPRARRRLALDSPGKPSSQAQQSRQADNERKGTPFAVDWSACATDLASGRRVKKRRDVDLVLSRAR